MTIDELVDELARPIFVLRMTYRESDFDTSMSRSCKTRARNARLEIDKIVHRYVKSNQSIFDYVW